MQHASHGNDRSTEPLDDFPPREGASNVPMNADLKGSKFTSTNEAFSVESGRDKNVASNNPNDRAMVNARRPESLNLGRLDVLKRSSSHDEFMNYGRTVIRSVSFEDAGEMMLKKSVSHESLVDYHPRPVLRRCTSSPADGLMRNGIASLNTHFLPRSSICICSVAQLYFMA